MGASFFGRVTGGAASVFYLLDGVDAAVAIQDEFKKKFGYEMDSELAQDLGDTLSPHAKVLKALYGDGRDRAVALFGDAAVTSAEVAAQVAVETFGVVKAVRCERHYSHHRIASR
jgi:hypothetical protein